MSLDTLERSIPHLGSPENRKLAQKITGVFIGYEF